MVSGERKGFNDVVEVEDLFRDQNASLALLPLAHDGAEPGNLQIGRAHV